MKLATLKLFLTTLKKMPDPNALWEDVAKLDALYEELCWDPDDELIFTHQDGRVVIYNKTQEENP